MAKYRITGPDGSTYEITAPEGASESDVLNYAKSQTKPKVKQFDINGPKGAASESGLENFAAGVGKAIYDTGRGLGQLVGAVSGADVKESRRLDKDLMDTGAGVAGNIAGNVGMVLAPGGLVKGAGMAANALGAPGRAAALSSAGGSLLAPRTIAGAGATGAGFGFIQPAEDGAERALNTGIGAGASMLIPAAVRGVQASKALAEPFYQSGRDQILSRALREASGGGQYADDALRNLQQSAAPAVGPFRPGAEKNIMGELVPGSVPTAGQASRNPGIAALERAATATNPAVTNEVAERVAGQNAARVGALENIAGSDGSRAFARAELEATADDLYTQAFQKGMNLGRDPVTGAFLSKSQQAARKGEITKLMRNPYIAEAAQEAKKLMQGSFKGTKDPLGSVEGLHFMKKALDDKIAGATGNEQRILIGARDRLLTTIDALSPDYAAARSVFKDMAKPVNQMDTAAEIAKNAINNRGNMTLDKFARGMSDKSAQTAQRFKKATLEGTMSNEQMNILQAIKDDLVRSDAAQNAGRGVGSDTVQKLAYSNILNQAGVPNFLRNLSGGQFVGGLLSRGSDLAYADANQRLSAQLAQSLLNPADTARLMAIQPSQRAQVIQGLLSRGGASAGLMAPGLLNANQ